MFANKPRASLSIGLFIIATYNIGAVSEKWPFTYILDHLPEYSNDYVGLFPWLGVVFVGIWSASLLFVKNDPLLNLKKHTWIVFPGKHSLVIYLVHQPVLFAIFGLIAYLSEG